MITDTDNQEHDFALLTRHRAMRPSMARIAFAEMASDLPMDELRHVADIFRHELAARQGRIKYTLPNAPRRANTTITKR